MVGEKKGISSYISSSSQKLESVKLQITHSIPKVHPHTRNPRPPPNMKFITIIPAFFAAVIVARNCTPDLKYCGSTLLNIGLCYSSMHTLSKTPLILPIFREVPGSD